MLNAKRNWIRGELVSLGRNDLKNRRQETCLGQGRYRHREMATYTLNRRAVAQCRKLIDARQYVLDSDWGEVAPTADDENAFLKTHSWDEYALWHLGLTDGATEETKARYAFVYGDFKRVHRTALIACVYRASEWRHKAIELAAHRLLQHLDKTSAAKT